MLFNLAKAIVMEVERKGEVYPVSPALVVMINRRLDRLRKQAEGQRKAKVPIDSAYNPRCENGRQASS